MSTQDNEMIEQLNHDGIILSFSVVGLAATVTEAEREGFTTDNVLQDLARERAVIIGTIQRWQRMVDACGGVGILEGIALGLYCTWLEPEDESPEVDDDQGYPPHVDIEEAEYDDGSTVAEQAGER